ncbi:glycosyltransferase family 4 protein [Muricoccus pecuniae]|uniref:Glycosyltransferase involved in cell wall biosynthesis n=1 Tax=Muricoccus pecuniae TaxID=693023 RepID=A0A840XUD9_9PROT|nr:glycosyltransferase family 1 protein [Roseomonas pecuniae]MBB5692165.1 glycosyltransferase involved in cell wall biosynthesis [Roseomonas pecuniae]
MRPRILIDGFNLALEQGTGVSTYARNLSYRLGTMGAEVEVLYGRPVSPKLKPLLREVTFFDDPSQRMMNIRPARQLRQMLLAGFNEKVVEVPVTGNVVTDTFSARMPHFDRLWNVEDVFTRSHNNFKIFKRVIPLPSPANSPELVHWTYPLPLRIQGAKNIYCFHDLVPLRLPFTTLDHKRRYYRLCMTLLAQADHIVTVSEASRRDIINLLGADPEKVTNTYQSVELPPKLADKPEDMARDEVAGSFGLDWKGYFMFFGAIEPKKNVGRMIEAFLASGSDLPLVIVGKQAWKSDQELKVLFDDHIKYISQENGRLVTRRKIVLLDYAPFRLLVSLIRGARAVLFPSLYEGFGLPALEAMSLGTPVLTSDTSSLPEVVGDAAVKVNPYDIRAMVEGIRALDADADLRGRLSLEGRRQAGFFSAEAYERRLSELYARLGVRFEPGAPPAPFSEPVLDSAPALR